VHWQSDALTTRLDLIRLRLIVQAISFFPGSRMRTYDFICSSIFPTDRDRNLDLRWSKYSFYANL